MKQHILSFLTLVFLAACASNEPKYQLGLDGTQQTKAEAEKAHAAQLPDIGPNQDQARSPPRVLSSNFPDYPQNLRKADITGKVIVEFFVERDGTVSDPTVVGSPPPELAAISLYAIARWKFHPATLGGAPLKVRARQTFEFKIE